MCRRGTKREMEIWVVAVVVMALLVHGTAAQEADSGWYFTETEIGVPFRPTDFQPGANIVGIFDEVYAMCPIGFVSSGCIASTVPPAIANIDIDGGVDFTRSGALLSVQPDAEVSGFNVFTVCLRFHHHRCRTNVRVRVHKIHE